MMSSTLPSYLRPRRRPGIAQWRVTAVAPAMAAILYLSFDLMDHFTAYSGASWLKGLESIAFLIWVIGAAVVALQARAEQAEHTAAAYESDNLAPPLRFYISDGGAGLPAKYEPLNRNTITAKPAPFFDGGSFPSQNWRHFFRR